MNESGTPVTLVPPTTTDEELAFFDTLAAQMRDYASANMPYGIVTTWAEFRACVEHARPTLYHYAYRAINNAKEQQP